MKKLTLFALILAFAVSCNNQQTKKNKAEAQKPEKIRIAYMLGHVPCIIAKHKKFFEEEFKNDNIEIEVRKFEFGPPLVEALSGGQLDVGTLGDQPAIIGWAKGVDYRIVGNSNGGNTKMAILLPENSKVKSFAELKGKKIAIAVGSNNLHFLHILLKKAGFTLDDIKLVNLKFPDSILALSLNQIDATIVSEPYITLATFKHKARILTYSGGYKYITLPIVATGNFIRNYPEYVVRILKVYCKANQWARENTEEATDILMKEENNLLPREVDLSLIDKYTANFGLSDTAVAAFRQTFEFLKEDKLISTDLNIDSIYTFRFEKEAFK
jgi:aliphatic sulfonates family ABC transporter substrate-binding protein